MGNSLKALAVAFLIMSLPIFVVTYVVFDSYRERDEKITIVPGKTYIQQETLGRTGRVKVVRTTHYHWKKCITETSIDTVKVDNNDAADAAYINHAVGISGW